MTARNYPHEVWVKACEHCAEAVVVQRDVLAGETMYRIPANDQFLIAPNDAGIHVIADKWLEIYLCNTFRQGYEATIQQLCDLANNPTLGNA